MEPLIIINPIFLCLNNHCTPFQLGGDTKGEDIHHQQDGGGEGEHQRDHAHQLQGKYSSAFITWFMRSTKTIACAYIIYTVKHLT